MLGDPNAIASAAAWLQAMLLGTIAATIAVIAIASIGFLMLSGRTDVRRAAHMIVGCFVIFGASAIASGMVGAISRVSDSDAVVQAPTPPPAVAPPVGYPNSNPSAFDPYAGAAVPSR